MLQTNLTRTFGLKSPILSAGMAFVARPQLAAAVSNAGGMGFLGADMASPEALADLIRQTRRLTSQPFGIDVMVPFFSEEHLDVCVAAQVPIVNFFWGYPQWEWVEKLQNAGSRVWMKVRSVDEAKGALQCGLDALVVQASEGGPGFSLTSLMTLLPAVVDMTPMPVIASGSILDGRGLAAALALGAEAVRCGTRFLSAVEAEAQSEYERRVGASLTDQNIGNNLFSREWPDAPADVAPERPVDEWTTPVVLFRPGAANPATASDSVPERGFHVAAFADSMGTMASTGMFPDTNAPVSELRPAAEIIQRMMRQAEGILAKYSRWQAVA
jgi:hypothetical protein